MLLLTLKGKKIFKKYSQCTSYVHVFNKCSFWSQIKEACDTVVLLNMKGEPRAGQTASKPANNEPKPVQRPATAAPSAAKVRKRDNC